MDDGLDRAEAHADRLAGDAEQLLERLDQEPPARGLDRLEPGRLGRLILWVGAIAVTAFIGTTVAITLIVLQYSTRTEVAERAARSALASVVQQQVELARAQETNRLADCALIGLFRVRPGDPPATPGRSELVTARVEEWYRARRCP